MAGADQFGSLRQGRRVAGHKHQVASLGGEGECRRTADPLGAARDQRPLAAELQIHGRRLEPGIGFCQKQAMANTPRPPARTMTDAQREYERKRAQKAGVSLDKWLDQKQRQSASAAPSAGQAGPQAWPAVPPAGPRAPAAQEEALIAAHADWSTDARKRWMTIAVGSPDGWSVDAPQPAGDLATLFDRLRARGPTVVLGVDFPLGLPRPLRRPSRDRAGLPSFPARASPSALASSRSATRWRSWRWIARSIRVGGLAGMTRLSHAAALGLGDAAGLSRLCDRATAERPAGAPLFWTLGANQSGKAAISAWRDLLLPALSGSDPPALWPFDGPLLSLLRPGRVAVAETYPAEALRQIGLRMGGSKRRQADRAALAAQLGAVMVGLAATPTPDFLAALPAGFGADAAGEDRFDSVLGLLCLLGVLAGRRPDTAPPDPWVRRWEGWVLGQTALASVRRHSGRLRKKRPEPPWGDAMIFRQLFDATSGTYSYLLASRIGGEALIIDPVLEKVDRYLQLMEQLDLRLVKAVDTHLHADHVTGLGALRDRTDCITVMGEQSGVDVVSMRLSDGDRLTVEGLSLDVIYTPGHTDDSYSFYMRDRVFSGDTLLIRGTGRTDFQNGDARAQYESIFNRLLRLPDDTLLFPAHDYKGDTVSTIGEERAFNPRLQVRSVEEYAEIMNNLNLPSPKLMDVVVPANRCVGLKLEVVEGDCTIPAAMARDWLGRADLVFVDLREREERVRARPHPGLPARAVSDGGRHHPAWRHVAGVVARGRAPTAVLLCLW